MNPIETDYEGLAFCDDKRCNFFPGAHEWKRRTVFKSDCTSVHVPTHPQIHLPTNVPRL